MNATLAFILVSAIFFMIIILKPAKCVVVRDDATFRTHVCDDGRTLVMLK